MAERPEEQKPVVYDLISELLALSMRLEASQAQKKAETIRLAHIQKQQILDSIAALRVEVNAVKPKELELGPKIVPRPVDKAELVGCLKKYVTAKNMSWEKYHMVVENTPKLCLASFEKANGLHPVSI